MISVIISIPAIPLPPATMVIPPVSVSVSVMGPTATATATPAVQMPVAVVSPIPPDLVSVVHIMGAPRGRRGDCGGSRSLLHWAWVLRGETCSGRRLLIAEVKTIPSGCSGAATRLFHLQGRGTGTAVSGGRVLWLAAPVVSCRPLPRKALPRTLPRTCVCGIFGSSGCRKPPRFILVGLCVPRLQQEAVPELGDGLGEVHFDASVVDQHVVHLLVGLDAGGFRLKLDERVV